MERGFLPDRLSGLTGRPGNHVASPYLSPWHHRLRVFRVGRHLGSIQAQVRHVSVAKVAMGEHEVRVSRNDDVLTVSHEYDSSELEARRNFDIAYFLNDRDRGVGFHARVNDKFDGFPEPVVAEHYSSHRVSALPFREVLDELIVIQNILPK